MGIEGTYLNIVKAIQESKLTGKANIIINNDKLKTHPTSTDQEQDKGIHFPHYYST